MALVPIASITQASNCQSITLTDITGDYDVTTNPTGWGAPNPATTDCSSIVITIYDYYHVNETEYNVPAADIADVFDAGLTITADDIFGITSFPDGSYTFIVTYTVSGTEYTYTVYKGFYCSALCCAKQMGLTLNPRTCDYSKIEEWNFIMNLLTTAFWATCCGHYDYFQEIIDYVNEICDGCGGSNNSSSSGSGSTGCGCS